MNGHGCAMRRLETPRLVLEPQRFTHADEMFVVLSDPAIYRFENAPPVSVDALRARYAALESRRSPDEREQWLNWVVRVKDGGAAIGYLQATVGSTGAALIGYEFNSAWWGRGLAHEAAAATVRELLEHHGARVVGAVFKRVNEPSRRLLGRLGMRAARPDEFPASQADADEDAMVFDRGPVA
jgi:ribosomal-protein-alanine N-acetyltransferase